MRARASLARLLPAASRRHRYGRHGRRARGGHGVRRHPLSAPPAPAPCAVTSGAHADRPVPRTGPPGDCTSTGRVGTRCPRRPRWWPPRWWPWPAPWSPTGCWSPCGRALAPAARGYEHFRLVRLRHPDRDRGAGGLCGVAGGVPDLGHAALAVPPARRRGDRGARGCPTSYLLVRRQPPRDVAVLMVLHLAVAVVTYQVVVRLAPPRRRRAGGGGRGGDRGRGVADRLAPPGRCSWPCWSEWSSPWASATLVVVPTGRPTGWWPEQGTVVYLAHALVGLPLGVSGRACFLRRGPALHPPAPAERLGRRGRAWPWPARAACWPWPTRSAWWGWRLMLVGPVVAGFGYLIPTFDRLSDESPRPDDGPTGGGATSGRRAREGVAVPVEMGPFGQREPPGRSEGTGRPTEGDHGHGERPCRGGRAGAPARPRTAWPAWSWPIPDRGRWPPTAGSGWRDRPRTEGWPRVRGPGPHTPPPVPGPLPCRSRPPGPPRRGARPAAGPRSGPRPPSPPGPPGEFGHLPAERRRPGPPRTPRAACSRRSGAWVAARRHCSTSWSGTGRGSNSPAGALVEDDVEEGAARLRRLGRHAGPRLCPGPGRRRREPAPESSDRQQGAVVWVCRALCPTRVRRSAGPDHEPFQVLLDTRHHDPGVGASQGIGQIRPR